MKRRLKLLKLLTKISGTLCVSQLPVAYPILIQTGVRILKMRLQTAAFSVRPCPLRYHENRYPKRQMLRQYEGQMPCPLSVCSTSKTTLTKLVALDPVLDAELGEALK